MKALKSNGKVLVEDYISFARFNLIKGKYHRVFVKTIPIFAAFVGVPIALFGLITRQYLYALGAFVFLYAVYSFMSSFKLSGKKMYIANARFAGASHKSVFGKNGFVYETAFEDGKIDRNEYYFEEVQKIYYAPQAIYIYLDKGSVFILPKRNFQVNEKEALAHLLKFVPSYKLVVCV